jgi:C1A family cysteine protease
MGRLTVPYRALGAIPDTHDARDFIFESRPRIFVGAIPLAIDLRNLCSPVRDQGQQGSCTGFAMATGFREFLELKTGTPKPLVPLSPAFLYYQERTIEGTANDCNAGAMIRDGMKTLTDIGVCPETDEPYDAQSCAAPSATAVTRAGAFKIAAYHRITTLFGLKQALASGSGCVVGIAVYASFESPDAQRTGHIPLPQPGEQGLGGHALFCCGYTDDTQSDGGGYLIAKNSWGTGFGDHGYVYLPYAYVVPKLMNDMWTGS